MFPAYLTDSRALCAVDQDSSDPALAEAATLARLILDRLPGRWDWKRLTYTPFSDGWRLYCLVPIAHRTNNTLTIRVFVKPDWRRVEVHPPYNREGVQHWNSHRPNDGSFLALYTKVADHVAPELDRTLPVAQGFIPPPA